MTLAACGSPEIGEMLANLGVTGPDLAVTIDKPGFFPEGIAIDGDKVYVGSATTGEIVVKDLATPGTAASTFVPDLPGQFGAVGLLVDKPAGRLWVCTADFALVTPSALKAFSLATGAQVGNFLLPGGANNFCNDLTRDFAGNIYVNESLGGRVLRLPAGGSAFEIWSADPRFSEPPPPGLPPSVAGVGINGIAADGDSIVVNKFNTGKLFRIPITPTGAAGAVEEIVVQPALSLTDGMKRIAPGVFLIVELPNRLVAVWANGTQGTKFIVDQTLDFPTAVAIRPHTAEAFVVESQLDHLLGLDPTPPVLPFKIQKFAATHPDAPGVVEP